MDKQPKNAANDNDNHAKLEEDIKSPDASISFQASLNSLATRWQTIDKLADEQQLVGTQLIQSYVKNLPSLPGVYRMLDKAGNVLYVGKARNLKRRVSNYTNLNKNSIRIQNMIMQTTDMEFILTNTETEALLLEANLIKALKPRYNILLRDDKSFPYLLINTEHKVPGIFKYRGTKNKRGSFYGPFASPTALNETLLIMQKAFLLRSCTDTMLANRTRPCLLYQIKRCSGPCTNEISLDDYNKLLQEAQAFLSGKDQQVIQTITNLMQKAAAEQHYEAAAIYRDRLTALSHINRHQNVNLTHLEEADIFAIAREANTLCIEVFFIRFKQNWGNKSYFLKIDPELSNSEIFLSFISQFYEDKQAPSTILLSHEIEDINLLQAALNKKEAKKITISSPQRGERKNVIEQAANNASQALSRYLAQTASQAKLLKQLAELLNLSQPIKRVEIYDNSHLSGTNALGVMVVAGTEGFIKKQYRKFNIKDINIAAGDDFAMMREVIYRRFSRLINSESEANITTDNNDSSSSDLPLYPEVILIDGGKGQLSAVNSVLEQLNLQDKVLAVGVAKGKDRNAGREQIFIKDQPGFTLPPQDPLLYFIQRLRDEAHRFAITSQRQKRKKEGFYNPLDEIEGIGAKRKKALLMHFGSLKAIKNAGIEDLMRVSGVSENIAQTIYNYFHN